jgi:hypothetical protein
MSGYAPDPRPNTGLWPTASAYTAQTGKTAPLYNQDQPIKPWGALDLDTVPDGSPVEASHLGYDQNGQPAILTVTYPALVMRSPNIGVFSDPAHPFPGWNDYVKGLPPTKTTFSFAPPFASFPPQRLEVSNLQTPAEAQRACGEIGAGAVAVVVTGQSGQVYNYDPGDARRVYDIQIGANQWSLRALLMQRFASGEWSPGTWNIDPVRGPVFTPETFPPMPHNQTTLPTPIDPKYLDRSKWEPFSVFPGVVGIRPVGTPVPPPITGGLTDAQAAQLTDIQTNVKTLLGRP